MDRNYLASLAGLFCETEAPTPGRVVRLGEDAAHHVRVRRLDVGDAVYLANGAGAHAIGAIVAISKKEVDVSISKVFFSDPPAAVHLVVPIADRDRMLWCAEKCTELGATSWRPVMWNRSRSVSPRGEGEAFRVRLRNRMTSALVQSHSPWLPDVHEDASLPDVVTRLPPDGTRLVLHAAGQPIAAQPLAAPVTIAIGPEGGMEEIELQQLRAAGFRMVSLGENILRFETAAIGALAIVRSALMVSRRPNSGVASEEAPNG